MLRFRTVIERQPSLSVCFCLLLSARLVSGPTRSLVSGLREVTRRVGTLLADCLVNNES
jgi:hypothetical protein